MNESSETMWERLIKCTVHLCMYVLYVRMYVCEGMDIGTEYVCIYSMCVFIYVCIYKCPCVVINDFIDADVRKNTVSMYECMYSNGHNFCKVRFFKAIDHENLYKRCLYEVFYVK